VKPAGLLAVLLLGLCATGCGGDGDDDLPNPVSQFNCSAPDAVIADQISMDCPSSTMGLIPISVTIGGPTTSGDIFGIKFDLVFDPLVLSFSSPALEGTFLDKDGAATIFQADVSPQDPGRLVVAITRQGNVAGVGATPPSELILGASFIGVASGTTDLAFENVEVVDSSLSPISSIQFGGPLSISFN
jgi:hypothetical protein